MNKKALIVISDVYPQGNGEHFLDKELHYLSKVYDRIFVFPLITTEVKGMRNLPVNGEMVMSIATKPKKINYSVIFKKSGLIISVLVKELFKNRKFSLFRLNFKENISLLIQNIESSLLLAQFIQLNKNKFHFSFYAVWNDEASLIMSLLKEEEKIKKFVMRVHGHDLFNERNPNNYHVFKKFKMDHCSMINVLSHDAMNYLLKEGYTKNKLKLSTFGTFNSENKLNLISNPDLFRIVSCSHLIPLKRVQMIAETILKLDFPVEWIHFGDGIEKESILSIISNFKNHQKGILKGDILNEDIIYFYQTEQVNLFLHLSESEGLGVALIEAISFGIPVIATDSGGVRDIVNDTTGILHPNNSNPDSISNSILKFKQSDFNRAEKRKKIHEFWKENFDAEKIYPEFADSFLNRENMN